MVHQMSKMQITASKTALFLQCPRPFSSDVELEGDEPGEAAVYGTRFHKTMAIKLLTTRGATYTLVNEELERHVLAAYDELQAWMQPGGNPWGLQFKVVGVEVSKGLHLEEEDGYEHYFKADPRDATLIDADGAHTYEGEGHIFGTGDVILEARALPRKVWRAANMYGKPEEAGEVPGDIFRVVLDHKTGRDHFSEYIYPSKMPQMQTLALLFDAHAVAILHSPADGPTTIYAENIDTGPFNETFFRALDLVDSGFLRPGPECRFCPARVSCPAKQGELIASTSALVAKAVGGIQARVEPIEPGRFHQMLGELERLAKMARAELREEVRAGALYERPDGKVLTLVTKEIERLSKKSILEAYGPKEGEKVLERLRMDGALQMVEQEELRAK